MYDYIRGDFDGLRSSLRAANLADFVSNDDVNLNIDWHNWKDALLAAVKDPVPWINEPIKKKSSRKSIKLFGVKV